MIFVLVLGFFRFFFLMSIERVFLCFRAKTLGHFQRRLIGYYFLLSAFQIEFLY